MEAKLLNPLTRTTPPLPTTLSSLQNHSTTINYRTFSPFLRRKLKFTPINSSSSSSSSEDTSPVSDTAPTRPQITPPPETVEVRFRRRSKRRSRQLRDGNEGGSAKAVAAPPVKKKWEEMSLAEKAVELYVGEKGVLFWLNKFAYASIFIVIGGWILFRFVGPSLNLYQLDTPPLAPGSIFKGSS